MRVVRLTIVLCFCVCCGCSYVEQGASFVPPYESAAGYRKVALNASTSADVLMAISKPESELLSQSKSVIASQGMKKRGRKLWLTMVAFDENELAAKRKYFFVVDEKAENILLLPKRRLDFDIGMAMDRKILDEPYANENARRIAILKRVIENSRRDTNEVAPDNKVIGICGALINQTLTTVLQRLEESPVLASKLSSSNGFGFDHITIGNGRIKMGVTGDIVSVEVRAGEFTWTFEDPFDLEQ